MGPSMPGSPCEEGTKNLRCDSSPGCRESWLGIKSRGPGARGHVGVPYLSSFLSRLSWLTHVALGTLKVEGGEKGKLRHRNPVISWVRWYDKSCWSSLSRRELLGMGSVSPEGPGGLPQALMTSLSLDRQLSMVPH